MYLQGTQFVTLQIRENEHTYFLFLRSMPLFLVSFFAAPDPGGAAYCIGERAGEGADVGGIAGGRAGGAAVEAGGAGAGSGRGLGKMCFSLLFL